jgi:DNA-binding MarR family transcriptional regulator
MRNLGGRLRNQSLLDDEALTIGQYRMLHVLQHHPETLRELADKHHVTPSTMSRSIDVLVQRNLVTRQDDPEDRRKVILRLTDEGQTLLARVDQESRATVASWIEQLSEAEQARLYDGLLVLRSLVSRMGGDES